MSTNGVTKPGPPSVRPRRDSWARISGSPSTSRRRNSIEAGSSSPSSRSPATRNTFGSGYFSGMGGSIGFANRPAAATWWSRIWGGSRRIPATTRRSPAFPGQCRGGPSTRGSSRADMYGEHRPYGYCYGGSGGRLQGLWACMENTEVWDGGVPFVIVAPQSLAPIVVLGASARHAESCGTSSLRDRGRARSGW